MNALTLHEPWATAIAIGLKRFETRDWETNYRGPVAIHAGKRKTEDGRYVFDDFAEHFKAAGFASFDDLPFGCVVARGVLAAVHTTWFLTQNDAGRRLFTRHALNPKAEYLLGDFADGRFAWRLENVQRLATPVPARGYQRLWRWEPGAERRAS